MIIAERKEIARPAHTVAWQLLDGRPASEDPLDCFVMLSIGTGDGSLGMLLGSNTLQNPQ